MPLLYVRRSIEIGVEDNGVLARASGERVFPRPAVATGTRSTDILLRSCQEPIRFDAPRLAGSKRGTGCMLASAIAAHLANARSLEDGVRKGKLFVFERFQKIDAA